MVIPDDSLWMELDLKCYSLPRPMTRSSSTCLSGCTWTLLAFIHPPLHCYFPSATWGEILDISHQPCYLPATCSISILKHSTQCIVGKPVIYKTHSWWQQQTSLSIQFNFVKLKTGPGLMWSRSDVFQVSSGPDVDCDWLVQCSDWLVGAESWLVELVFPPH